MIYITTEPGTTTSDPEAEANVIEEVQFVEVYMCISHVDFIYTCVLHFRHVVKKTNYRITQTALMKW